MANTHPRASHPPFPPNLSAFHVFSLCLLPLPCPLPLHHQQYHRQLSAPRAPAQVLQVLQAVMERVEPTLVADRADRAARQETQQLRAEQDRAYQESLRRDRERVGWEGVCVLKGGGGGGKIWGF